MIRWIGKAFHFGANRVVSFFAADCPLSWNMVDEGKSPTSESSRIGTHDEAGSKR